MSASEKHSKECGQVRTIGENLSQGGRISPEEQALVQRHLEQCDACHAERRLFDALRFSSQGGPVAPLDEVSRRRLVGRVLDRLAQEPDPTAEVADPTRRGWLAGWRLAGTAAAAVLLGIGLALALWPSTVTFPRLDLKPVADSLAQGRVLLVSGQATLRQSPLQVGDAVVTGRKLSVGAGAVAINLAPGVSALLGPNTSASVERLDRDRVTVKLDTGRLLGRVARTRSGPRVFVRTAAGQIEITGTVFSVTARATGVRLAVLRGHVKIPGRPGELRRDQAAMLGRPAIEALTPRERRTLQLGAIRLELLTAEHRSLIRVTTQPPGAELQVDGIPIGRTPVVAVLPVGDRRLEVSHKGFAPIREFAHAKLGQILERDFELKAQAKKGGPSPPVPKDPIIRRIPGTGDADAVAALLKLAQQRLIARDWRGAHSAYRALIRQHPRRPEATAALVSIGMIQLDRLNQAAAALRNFDRYLRQRRSGLLAQEATYARARALRALGRRAEEVQTLKRFLRRYPRSVLIAQVKRRLKQLAVHGPIRK